MHGLVAYDEDSQSDTERDTARPSTSTFANDKSLKANSSASSDPRRALKSQVIIRRPQTLSKIHPRSHVSADLVEEPKSSSSSANQPPSTNLDGSDSQPDSAEIDQPPDELARVRAILKPPPIPDVVDWGIPPESTAPCDPATESRLSNFHALKRHPTNPKHFNDTMIASRNFRNPHLYARLVDFVDVDERTTNFSKELWDPKDVQESWFADRIAEAQKRSDQQQSASLPQASGKRTHIDFASAKSSRPKEKDRESSVLGGGKRSRYQPYGLSHSGDKGGYSLGKGRVPEQGASRWR